MGFRTELVIPKTVEDYAVSRDEVVGMVRGYYKAVEIANQAMNEISNYLIIAKRYGGNAISKERR